MATYYSSENISCEQQTSFTRRETIFDRLVQYSNKLSRTWLFLTSYSLKADSCRSMYYMNPMAMTMAGPLMSSYPYYGGGMMGMMGGGFGRFGYGHNYGLGGYGSGYGSFYSPYNYMAGSYW